MEYACRVLAQLARLSANEELAHIETLAKAEEIPANYLAQILSELRNGGLIISRRGKFGGYALARHPEEISLFDIIKVVDPEMTEFQPNLKGASGERVSEIWKEVQRAFVAKTKEYTLDMMASDGDEEMYYI